jgi:hypothetical protein
MTRLFLAIVGVVYIFLAGWCSLMPDKTSNVVGFTLQPGSGQSEFLTVYGGLELALGLAFLWPLIRPAEVAHSLMLCLLVHGSLVAFRTTGFVFYSGIPTATYWFAATEWFLFLASAMLFCGRR